MYIDLGGVALLILMLSVFITVGIVMVKQGRPRQPQYDERQELVRGRGFQYGFIATGACLLLEVAYGDWLGQFIERDMLALLCLGIGVLVDTVYMIWHDGYFPVNEHPLLVVLSLSLLLGLSLFRAVHAVRIGVLVQDKEPLGGVGYLIWTVILLIELLAVLLRYYWNKRKEG